ncbi:hypothetical protein PINS_up001970 [Pythium insidiosum]|nr:hypothetical protein PINS_up001970 [Pythium insidiosum]
MYFVTKIDLYRPDATIGAGAAVGGAAAGMPGTEPQLSEDSAPVSMAADADKDEADSTKDPGINDYITLYVAVCGNGSVMVPMSVFPPVETWHWERKKPVKLRHAHSMHRTKRNDPMEALQFFSVTWKKFYDEEAKYSDKFVFLLDAAVEEFRAPEFTEGLKQLDGYGKYWTSFYTVRNPLRHSSYEDVLCTFVLEEWRRILTLKKSSQPNDYRKCVAFWFYTAWEFFAGENARSAFRSCNMYLEDKSSWSIDMGVDSVNPASVVATVAQTMPVATATIDMTSTSVTETVVQVQEVAPVSSTEVSDEAATVSADHVAFMETNADADPNGGVISMTTESLQGVQSAAVETREV